MVGADQSGDISVFSYGSLMWRPDFPYLDSRELITHAYLRRNVPVAINGARIKAVCHVAGPGHVHYAGALPLGEAARVIRSGRGVSGDNPYYLRNVAAHLDELSIADAPIHRLMDLVKEVAAP